MLFSKKSLIYFLTIILLFSLVANVYVFSKRNKVNDNLNGKLNAYETELSDIKKKNDDLNKRLSLTKTPEENEGNQENQSAEQSGNGDEQTEYDLVYEIENTVNRFVEYTFNTEADNYVDRKKLAKNYMTDNLFDIIFTADGVDESAQKIKLETGRVDIFINNNSDEVIVFYTLDKELLQSGYKETVENYIKLEVVQEDNHLKVSNIEPLIMTEGGLWFWRKKEKI